VKLLLVRHGESVWNAQRLLQGQRDLPLSEKGRIQAQQLRPVVQAHSPEHVVASDLARAKETAKLLGYEQPCLETAWREAFLGDWEGAGIEELRQAQPEQYRAWRDGAFDPPNAEAFAMFYKRIKTAIDALSSLQASSVLVVTHGGVVRAALQALLALSPKQIIPVSPASLTVIDLVPEPRLRAYNITSFEAMSDPPD
jgi:glucosyl-3-phosphoglycerate phosphatase